MRKLLIAISVAAGFSMIGSADALTTGQPASLTAAIEDIGVAETVHCRPGRWHHVPRWNYRADGCRRPARKGVRRAPAKG